MLGNNKVENYHPNFIIKLVDYANQLDYQKALEEDKNFILNLAQKWPSKCYLNSKLYY